MSYHVVVRPFAQEHGGRSTLWSTHTTLAEAKEAVTRLIERTDGYVKKDDVEIAVTVSSERAPCPAFIRHGPGHQSKTGCRLRDEHELHEAVYGALNVFVQWRGDETTTDLFDEPPEVEE